MTESTAMEIIDQRARDYARARDELAERVRSLTDEIEQLKRRRIRGIKSAARTAAERKDELRAAVEQHPECFQRPRTVTIAGVRVGWTKGKGKIEFDDSARVVALIRKHFPEQADTLVKVTEAPVKKALGQLSTAELKKIGCRVTETDDEVMIKPVDGEIDKLVDRLLDDAEDLDEEAA